MEDAFDDEACRALSSLLESYIRMLAEEQKKQPSNKTTPLIDNVKAYVGENLECSVSLSDAARLFHYHEQYLGRLFKRETGMRFSDYINAQRVKKAATYLEREENVIRAAYQVGFHNVTYFNRVFKRHFGMTPTEYKKEVKRRK
jgi:two-component system response regulator YesN